MFGDSFKCTKCEFEFSNGWNHHAGGQGLVCIGCGTRFTAFDKEWSFGPGRKQQLRLIQTVYNKAKKKFGMKDTGIKLRLSEKPNPAATDGVGLWFHESLEKLDCPACGKTGGVVETIINDPPCPRCRKGKVVKYGSCIY
jgi:hypothetical protein